MPEPPALPAVILLAHGSPDPDWRRPIEAVRDRMRALDPLRDVVDAYFSSCAPSLPEAVDALVAAGHTHVHVIAMFLSPGGNHLKRDVPALIEQVRAAHTQLDLELHAGALGDQDEIVDALARNALGRVLMSGHGD